MNVQTPPVMTHHPRLRAALRGGYVVPVVAFMGFVLLYLATLVEAHTYDALSYGLAVDRKPLAELFHPHHIAYGPLGAALRGLAGWLGWQGSALPAMQVANAIAGAAGVALFAALVQRVTHRADAALVAAVLLGGSYAYWYYAVEVEVYTFAALFLIACLGVMARMLAAPSLRDAVLLGGAAAGAILFHQTNVLLAVPVAVLLLLAHDGRFTMALWRQAAACAGTVVLLVGGVYLYVGFAVSGFASLGEWWAWMTAYAQTGYWGGTTDTAAGLMTGLASALAHPVGGVLWAVLAGLLVVYARQLGRQYGRLALVLVSWLLVYGAFFAWWEPQNAEFWIASMPPVLLLLALALAAGGAAWHRGVWVALAVAAVMLVGNWQAVLVRGQGGDAPQFALTRALVAHSTPADLLLVPDGWQALALSYYAGRDNVLALSDALEQQGGDWQATCDQLTQRIATTQQQGGAVLIADGARAPATLDRRYYDPLTQRFGLVQADLDACFAPYVGLAEPVPALATASGGYVRLPAAAERAAGDGWHFTTDTLGWQAQQVAQQRVTADGWLLTPRVDPAVYSPRVPLDTAQYGAIEVVLTNTLPNREGQLFWLDADGQTDETRAVRWELAPDATRTTYTLDLRDHPAWTGTVYGLRLDPTSGQADGDGTVTLHRVRLLPRAALPPR